MTFAKKTTFLALLMLATCFTAAAQDRVLKFKLTREAHIGNATLTAGDYRMVMTYDASRPLVIVRPVDGHGASVLAMPANYDFNSSCKTSSLTLTSAGDSWQMTSVCFADSATALYFAGAESRKSDVVTQTTAATALAGAQ